MKYTRQKEKPEDNRPPVVVIVRQLFEKAHQTGLLKMMIIGERRDDAPLLHDNKTGAVHETPQLVRSVVKQCMGRFVEIRVNVDDFDPRSILDCT